MRVIFMGTPEFAVPALMAIANGGFELAAVYTREPARGGRRGLEIRKAPVHEAADSLAIPVFTPRTLRDAEVQKAFSEFAADVAVVAAYGLILPVPVLEAPKLGRSTCMGRFCRAGEARRRSSGRSWPATKRRAST